MKNIRFTEIWIGLFYSIERNFIHDNNVAGYMERLHEEVIVESMPEKVASDMKQYFA